MKKHFFNHLVKAEDLHEELEKLEMSTDEKIHIMKLIDESIHHTILDTILSELSDDDKKAFLSHLDSEDHDQIWEFVNGKIENIEDKIKRAAEDIKSELHLDVKSAREGRKH